MARMRVHIGRSVFVLMVLFAAGLPLLQPAPASAAVVGNDYPAKLHEAAPNWQNSVNDGRGFFVRNCTSFVAWRMAQVNGVNFTNTMKGPNGKSGRFGNANNWDDNARAIGYTVDNIPKVGAIAQTDAWTYGHVAWVADVHGDGTITIEQYNGNNADSNYSVKRFKASGFRFIHVKDLAAPTPTTTTTTSPPLPKTPPPCVGCADVAVFNPKAALWTTRAFQKAFGSPGDIPVPGDWNGDGTTDFGVWNPNAALWTTPFFQKTFGTPGDIPVPGDWNGDGTTDFGVWNPSNALWTTSRFQGAFGSPGDVPLAGKW